VVGITLFLIRIAGRSVSARRGGSQELPLTVHRKCTDSQCHGDRVAAVLWASGGLWKNDLKKKDQCLMADFIDEDGYRANVGIILTNGNGRLFWGGRAGRDGWQFPQGGIYPGESATEAMFRELTEEIGLVETDVEIMGSTRGWLRYRLPRRYIRRNSQPVCVGQKQRWFMLRLAAPESRVRFDHTSHPEFDRWRWVEYWHPLREVIYFKRRVYRRALQELGRFAFPNGPPPCPRSRPGKPHRER
jgi:putative (di)nucleoside polyphosphate hydrolase